MLRNIDIAKLRAIRMRDPEAAEIIDALIQNHKEIVGSLSHEIRNPLSTISCSLQIIEDQHPEVAYYKFWNDTRSDVTDMTALLNDLSEFNNSQNIKREKLLLLPLFRHIGISFAVSVENTDIHFTYDLPERLPTMLGDRIKLQQVFYNILGNARDALSFRYFGDPCEIKLIVRESMVKGKRAIIAEVQDNGLGVPEEHINDIFEPFKTYKASGTGLGLAISQNIVEAHNGTISVQSEPHKGTVFTIILPVE